MTVAVIESKREEQMDTLQEYNIKWNALPSVLVVFQWNPAIVISDVQPLHPVNFILPLLLLCIHTKW